MPGVKERARVIYELALEKKVSAITWRNLKTQMIAAKMPLTVDNLRFVAKCKKVAPKKAIASEALQLVVNSAAELEGQVVGAEIKRYVLAKCPQISRDKFYRVFREEGFNFRNERVYDIRDLGEVLYRLFS